MSAETMGRLADVATRNAGAHEVCRAITDALSNPRKAGTMKEWFYGKGGCGITTVQVNGMGVWAPTGRTASTRAASYVTLDGSRRDYAGLRVVHADANLLIVDGERETIAYHLEPEH